jgi:hypothetical protein
MHQSLVDLLRLYSSSFDLEALNQGVGNVFVATSICVGAHSYCAAGQDYMFTEADLVCEKYDCVLNNKFGEREKLHCW